MAGKHPTVDKARKSLLSSPPTIVRSRHGRLVGRRSHFNVAVLRAHYEGLQENITNGNENFPSIPTASPEISKRQPLAEARMDSVN